MTMSAKLQNTLHCSRVRSGDRIHRPFHRSDGGNRVSCRAAQTSTSSSLPAEQSYNMLEAFFIGRALAEVLNERLGMYAADVLAEVGKFDGEFRREIKEIQEEVLLRARNEMNAATGGSNSSSSTSSYSNNGTNMKSNNARQSINGGSKRDRNESSNSSLRPATADVGEAVDNLRAEVASARAVVQQIKQSKQQQR